MQCNIKIQKRVSYEYKKNSPKRDKIVRNLETSLLGEIDNLTSINPPNWKYCNGKLFWSSLWETWEPRLKGLYSVN